MIGKNRKILFFSYFFLSLFSFSAIMESESLTITTYYPAPYGGYSRLLTTDTTLLARNTGSVGIGTPYPQFKLDVQNGSIRTSGMIGTNGYSPDSGYPSGWNGGINTWDIYAHGSVRADEQFCIGVDCIRVWPVCKWQAYRSNSVTECSNWLNVSNYSRISIVAVADNYFQWFGNTPIPNGGFMLCCYIP